MRNEKREMKREKRKAMTNGESGMGNEKREMRNEKREMKREKRKAMTNGESGMGNEE